MENTTVEEMIEMLKKMNPKAVLCHMELCDDEPVYSTLETCVQYDNVTYIDDNGDDQVGSVIAVS